MIPITEEQVAAALPMSEAIELVEESFRRLNDGRAHNHPRRRIQLPNKSMLHAMDAGDAVSNRFAAKLYVTRPAAGATFLVALFDAETTALLATIDANRLGQIRTGAATGVATKYLAREDAATVGLYGSGFQAETQLEAVAAVRPIERARVYSPTPEHREAFAHKMSERLGLRVEAVDSGRAAAEDAAILITATKAREPVLLGDWLEPGCHINAAGSNHAKRREIDRAVITRCDFLCADSVEEARIESGDLIQAVDEGVIAWGRVAEFSGVVGGRTAGRKSAETVTLFESQGLALQDLAAAEHVYRKLQQS